MLLIVAVGILVLFLAAEKLFPRPTVHLMQLHQRIVPEGDEVLLLWRVRDALVITVRDSVGTRYRIRARKGEGTTPLRIRSNGYLHVEVSNLGRTVTTAIGPVRVVRMPMIRYATIRDPALNRASDADVADLADSLHRLADALPDWRKARPPASHTAANPGRA